MNENIMKTVKREMLAKAKDKFNVFKAEQLALMNEAEDAIERAYENYERETRDINRMLGTFSNKFEFIKK